MGALEIRKLCPELEAPLAHLFETLHREGQARFFHPHPFTREEAERR